MMVNWHDYRAKSSFTDGYPNLAIEVRVTKPVEAFCIFSQPDKRGLAPSDPNSKYHAVMLSVLKSVGNSRVEVDLNSTAYCDAPSKEFAFNHSRDLSMSYLFTPECSPYYIVPWVYDTGSNEGLLAGTHFEYSAVGLEVAFNHLDRTCKSVSKLCKVHGSGGRQHGGGQRAVPIQSGGRVGHHEGWFWNQYLMGSPPPSPNCFVRNDF